MNDIYNWMTEHKAAIGIALGWLIHMGFPALQGYCQSRDGGVIPGIFFKVFGRPKTISQDSPADKPKQIV
jgi:hypothetical protein